MADWQMDADKMKRWFGTYLDILAISGGHVDLKGALSIKNIPGYGGSAGKAVRIVSTYAELKAACEDSSVRRVECEQAIYTGDTAIAITSYKYVLGLGHVQLDWNGITNGYIFGTAGDHILFENLHFLVGGNTYRPFQFTGSSGYITLKNVTTDYQANGIYLFGSHIKFIDCPAIGNTTYLQNAAITDVYAVRTTFERPLYFYQGSLMHIEHCVFDQSAGKLGYLVFSVGGSLRDVHVDHCDVVGNTQLYGILFGVSGTRVAENIKITNGTITAAANRWGILLNGATLTINDLWVENNAFRDMPTGFGLKILGGTLNRPRFINNRYDNVGTPLDFSGGTVNNPVYCMDGN